MLNPIVECPLAPRMQLNLSFDCIIASGHHWLRDRSDSSSLLPDPQHTRYDDNTPASSRKAKQLIIREFGAIVD